MFPCMTWSLTELGMLPPSVSCPTGEAGDVCSAQKHPEAGSRSHKGCSASDGHRPWPVSIQAPSPARRLKHQQANDSRWVVNQWVRSPPSLLGAADT